MTASSWLPQYLTRVQPYSMGPVLGYEWPDMLMPPAGTCVWLDNVALSAAAMWMAPAPVRREARRLGLPVPRLRVPGLAEALERAGVKTWQGPKGEVKAVLEKIADDALSAQPRGEGDG